MLNLWLFLNNYGYLVMIMLLSISFASICIEVARLRRMIQIVDMHANVAFDTIVEHVTREASDEGR